MVNGIFVLAPRHNNTARFMCAVCNAIGNRLIYMAKLEGSACRNRSLPQCFQLLASFWCFYYTFFLIHLILSLFCDIPFIPPSLCSWCYCHHRRPCCYFDYPIVDCSALSFNLSDMSPTFFFKIIHLWICFKNS